MCGDHRDTASIQGALFSGRRAATAVIADLTEHRLTTPDPVRFSGHRHDVVC